jgi:D-serine deaminase-like pyridoxal phosphate-dependent protein
MALYFAKHGWSDITVAFIVNLLELDKINELADNIRLNLLVDSEQVLFTLNQNLKHKVGMWIKVDTGLHRTGLMWDDFEGIRSLTQNIKESPRLDFKGLLTHAGHSYKASSVEKIKKIYTESVARLLAIKEYLKDANIQSCQISIGDTPTCSIAEDFEGVDEIRPGNFVFYDLMQEKLGSCSEKEIAVAVACPIIGKYKDRKQIAVYGGAVHLSSSYILDDKGKQSFGYLTSLKKGSFGPIDKKAPVINLTQEHGIIQINDKLFGEIETADLLFVFPVHSCLTCNLYKEYKTLDGEVISRM